MKKTLAIGLLALAPIGWAQEIVRKVIPVKYANMYQVTELVKVFDAASVQIGDSIAVRGRPEAVEAIEAALKKIDVPPPVAPDVELTVYLIEALSAGAHAVPAGAPFPAGLEPVVKQLRGVFAYRDYRVMESFVMRVRSGTGGSNNGAIGDNGHYSLHFASLTSTEKPNGHSIRVSGLGLGLEAGMSSSQIQTDIDIGEGQKAVVGKTSLPNLAVILVLSARVVD